MSGLAIPDMSLVVLVGASGSGKSTFARTHFAPSQVLSSDVFRAMVADDENDQSATGDAFDALHYVAGKRLAAGRITVIDATNVQRAARAGLIALAKEHDVLPTAIVLDLPESVCVRRTEARSDRDFGAHVVRRQRAELKGSLKTLQREGFRRVHVLRSEAEVAEVAAAGIVVEPLLNDRRELTGPFDVIGDVHGCRAELVELLGKLGYVDGRPPPGRTAVFVGDLVDRGPDTPGVLRLVMDMVERGDALVVCGNHEQKLERSLAGRKVTRSHGLAETLAQLDEQPAEFRERVGAFVSGLVAHYVLDGGNLVVAHAGLLERYHGRASGRVRSFALYGDTTGETDEYGLPVRLPWARDYRGRATVLYGHVPSPEAEWVNNTMCLDTGCVFGNKLTALRYPEREVVSVPAHRTWYEPVKPLLPADVAAPQREPEVLELGDVTGKRVLETTHLRRVGVSAEQSAAALEVMSRFAVDPRSLWYLPPTMAPGGTSTVDGYLEHPSDAFADYLAAGVQTVVCQEKHMGSRAVLLVRRDGTGIVHTRTGRRFFPPATEELLLGRLSAAATSAGLFAEFGSDWLLLDAELMPWSLKAGELVAEQYAAVGAAAAGALPPAITALESAAGRGVDVATLLDRVRARASTVEPFRAAYRRYCWDVDGLDGVRLAPFQLLATEGATHHETPHAEHLRIAGQLAEHAGGLVVRTASRTVDLTDQSEVDAATAWWLELTGSGGEGMVVKPAANLTRGAKGLVQPGLKVRGRDYLRLVYGPDYTAPENLGRLRERGLGRKRGLALREYALGIEALLRLAAGEPLWRVHECVFAVLALESDPVDPRL